MNAPRNVEPNPVVTGEMLAGRYSLQSQSGERPGLWSAQDEIEDRPVLLQFLAPELQQDPRALEALQAQVEQGRALEHPLLARVHDLVLEPDTPAFLVLEQAEGRTLAALQREQPQGVFTWDSLGPRAKQLCDALRYAHEHGVVHGGVHPENIVINRMGDARLLCCGVSTVLFHPLYSGTACQERLGYCSPQLLEGKTPTAADDVYALGVVLYQALSGTTPFYGEDLLSQIRNLPPASLEARLQELKLTNPVPVPLSRFILAALSRNAEVRPVDLRLPGGVPSLTTEAAESASPETAQAAPEVADLPDALVGADTETATAGAEEELEEVRRMRAAIQRDRRRRWLVGLSVLGVALATVGFCFRSGLLDMFRTTKAKQTASAPPKSTPKPGVPAAVGPQASVTPSPTASKPTGPVLAPAPPAPDPEQGFQPLFNGRDLSGWSGDPRHWLVRDGMIVGRALPGEPAKLHSYLVCDQGAKEDFELRFSFRCLAYKHNERPNGGVEYRAARLDGSRMKGYQYEIVRDAPEVGAVMDDQGRALLGSQGAKVVASSEGGRDALRTVGAVTPSNLVATALQREDWNEGVILAKGNRLVHKLNGQVMADVQDDCLAKSHPSGLIALEIYLRNTNNPATFIMFKDIRLKSLKEGGR